MLPVISERENTCRCGVSFGSVCIVTGGVTGVAENQIKVKEINDGGGKEIRLKKSSDL